MAISALLSNPQLSKQSRRKSKPANSDLNLLTANPINIRTVTAPTIDVVLFRVDTNHKVRGDKNIIFYGQTNSEDGSIELDQQFEDDKSVFEFNCDLSAQPNAIDQIAFVLSAELDSLNLYLGQAPIELIITDRQNNSVLFSSEFSINDKASQSLLLSTLSRENNQWRFAPKDQTINGDLRYLCEKYGVELSDD